MLLEAKVFSFFQFFFCRSFEDSRCTYKQISERNSAVWGRALLILPVHFSHESFEGVHINRLVRGTCFQGLSSMNLYSYMWWSENSVPWPWSERVLHNVLDGWKKCTAFMNIIVMPHNAFIGYAYLHLAVFLFCCFFCKYFIPNLVRVCTIRLGLIQEDGRDLHTCLPFEWWCQ